MNKKNLMAQENDSVNHITEMVELTDEDLQQVAGGPSRVDVNALEPIVGRWKTFGHSVQDKTNLQTRKLGQDITLTG